MKHKETLFVASCYLAIFAFLVIGFAAAFSPQPRELIVVALFLGCCMCQIRMALMMAEDGVADLVTAMIFAIVLAPLLYVMGWLYARDWQCRGLMSIWTGLSIGLILMLTFF